MESILCVEAIWSPVWGITLNIDSADADLRSTFTASEAPRCGDRLWYRRPLATLNAYRPMWGERVKVLRGVHLRCEHGDVLTSSHCAFPLDGVAFPGPSTYPSTYVYFRAIAKNCALRYCFGRFRFRKPISGIKNGATPIDHFPVRFRILLPRAPRLSRELTHVHVRVRAKDK